jgi:hypothetical protein
MMSKQEETVGVSPELNQEIEGAVTDAVEKAEAVRKAAEDHAKPGDEPTTEPGEDKGANADVPPPEGDKGGKKDDPPPPETISDDLIERAIRAGIPMKDAREIKNSEVLGRMCEKLESAGKATEERKPGGDSKEEGGDDPLKDVPDLNPEEYDEKIVAGFKAMKDIIRKQHAMIAKLGEGSARQEEATIDTRLQGLGKAFAEAAPAGSEKRAELEKKITVLKAGYKAAGEDVADDAVFQEAAKIALGDVEDSEADGRKAAALDKRRKLHLNRPSGSSIKPAGDVLADVAAEIDARFGEKK